MTEDWSEVLESRDLEMQKDLESGDTPRRVDVETPAGFGRGEYDRMIEELWSDGDIQKMTSLDRGLDLMDEAALTTADSLQGIYETTVSGEFDSEKYGVGALGLMLGPIGVIGTPFFTAMDWGAKSVSTNVQDPLNTSSDVIYDTTGDIEEEASRVFYDEGSEGRYVRFIHPIGEDLDRTVVEEGLDYLEDFQA